MSSQNNKKNIKNVVIINDFNFIQGGASKVAIDTAQLLKKNGFNVYFFSAVNKIEDNIDGIKYISTKQNEALKEKNRIKGFFNGIYNFKAKNDLKKLLMILDKNETIIHIHGWTKALSSSVFDIAFKMNFNVVLTLHDYFSACPNGGYYNYKINKICNFKPLEWKCITCNCDSRNYMFKLYRLIRLFVQNKIVKLNDKLKYAIGISDMNIAVLKQTLNSNINLQKIYNPIEFNFNNIINNNFYDNDYFLYVGRISKEKGVNLFCEAISKLNLKGIVVGDGSEKEKLQKEYQSIKFVGWKNNNDVKEYMNKAKCLIFPSLWYEGAPLTPLEALSAGIPVLISKYCSAREYVEEDFLFEDVDTLIDRIKFISNVENKKFCEKKIREYVSKIKSNNYIDNLLKFYQKIGEDSL